MQTIREHVKTANFGCSSYYGEREDWLIGFSTTRDADTLLESNWEVITKDMQERFPEDTAIERFNHWVCGWIDHLLIRPGTDAETAMQVWRDKLEDYPVADEEHYSQKEYNAHLEGTCEDGCDYCTEELDRHQTGKCQHRLEICKHCREEHDEHEQNHDFMDEDDGCYWCSIQREQYTIHCITHYTFLDGCDWCDEHRTELDRQVLSGQPWYRIDDRPMPSLTLHAPEQLALTG